MSIYEMKNNEISRVSGATDSMPLGGFWNPTPWYAIIDPLTADITMGHGEIAFQQLNIDNPFLNK